MQLHGFGHPVAGLPDAEDVLDVEEGDLDAPPPTTRKCKIVRTLPDLRKRRDSNPRSLAGRSLSRCSVGWPWGALVLVSGPVSFALVQLGDIRVVVSVDVSGRATASLGQACGSPWGGRRGFALRPSPEICLPVNMSCATARV